MTLHDDSRSTKDNEFRFTPRAGLEAVKDYFIGLKSGETFHYRQGSDREPSFFRDIGSYLMSSYFYLVVSGLIAVVVSLIIGAWQAKSKQEWAKDMLGFLGVIPDFILVLLLQLAVVSVYQSTGIHVAKVASSSTDNPAILLPIITLSVIPVIYLIRTLSEQTFEVLTEDYILTAKSKGISRLSIYIQHVFRNIIPSLKADLHKIAAIMMGNLFIVEYLYNTRGVTGLMFIEGDYQYNLIVNGLLTLVILYLFFYWSMRLFVFGLERIFAYE
ncbi:MAG TPA: ABC transporter permease subunit [Bacillales bacterium]